MAKKMPLSPVVEEENKGVPSEHPPVFMPGFAGVVSKIPPATRRPLQVDDALESPAEASPAVVSPVTRETEIRGVPSEQVDTVFDIPLELIDVSPFQPRISIDEDAVRRLAEAILSEGQINPVVVRVKDGGRFELVAGERRWRASKLLGKRTIKGIVRALPDSDAEVMALTDNDAREDLTDFERAKGYQRLIDKKIVATQSELARRTGKDRIYIVRCLSYFRLPQEVWPLLEECPGFLGVSYAQKFAAFMDKHGGNDADLVTAAIRKVFDAKLKTDADPSINASNALAWLSSQVRQRYNPSAPAHDQVWEHAGRRIGQFKIEGRKLVISCADGVSPDELINKLLSAEFKI